jgi:hypothetical protein
MVVSGTFSRIDLNGERRGPASEARLIWRCCDILIRVVSYQDLEAKDPGQRVERFRKVKAFEHIGERIKVLVCPEDRDYGVVSSKNVSLKPGDSRLHR